MNVIGSIAATAAVGGLAGAGATALATRDSTSGDGASSTAKRLGIAAGVTGAIGLAGLAVAHVVSGRGGDCAGMANSIIGTLYIGMPSVALTGVAAGLGGAALGTALVGSRID